MATIANLNVQLQASPAGLVAGLATAKSAVARTGSYITGVTSRINSAIAGIGSQAASGDFVGALRTSVGVAGGLASMLAAAAAAAAGLPEVGAAAAVGIGAAAAAAGMLVSALAKVKALFDEGASSVLGVRTASIKLGESFQEAAALSLAAGGNVERMTSAMSHLNSTIQAARTGDTGAIELLSGKLHLNVEELAKMGAGDRLGSVIKALGGINDELTKSSLEVGALGERAELAFGPLLSSAKGMEEFREQAKRLGLDLGAASSGEAKAMAGRIAEASRAVNQIGLAWQGVKMNIAAGLAPVLAKVADLFSGISVKAKDIQRWSVEGAKWLAKAGAFAYESWKELLNLWDRLEIGFADMLSDMEDGLLALAQQLQKLPFLGENGVKQARELAAELMDLRVKIDAGAAEKRLDSRKKERSAFDAVEGFFSDMNNDIETRKKLAEKVEANRKRYEPMRVPIQLSGAQEAGSQEAYKTLGTFAIGHRSNLAREQLVQAQRIEQAIQKGDITLKDIRNILKRHGIVKTGKI